MDVERKIFGNTIFLVAGRIVTQAANFGFIILFARAFGAQTLGIYSFAMAIGALLCIFVSFGTNSLAAKEISREHQTDCSLIGKIFPLQFMAGTVIWSALAIATFVFADDKYVAGIIVVVALFHVIQKWQSLLLTRFQSRQLMLLVAAVQGGTRVGMLVLGGLAIYVLDDPMITVASLPASAMVLLFVVYLGGARQFGAPQFTLRYGETLAIIKRAWPFMSVMALTVVYERLGVIFLGIFQSDSDIGYFASAERLLVPFIGMFLALVGALLPALSKIPSDESLERDALARRFLRVLLVLILPTATLVYLFRSDIILLLYGADFNEATAVLGILAWMIALRGFNAFLSMFSISVNMQSRLGMLKLYALLVFVALCLSLIPRYSYLGLAHAMVVSEIFLAVVLYWSIHRKKFLPGLLVILWRPLFCCLITIAVTTILPALPFGYRLLISLLTIIATAFLTGAVKYHDLGYLLRIARSRRSSDSDPNQVG